MEILVLALLGLAAGAAIPVQAGMNSAVGRALGRPEWAALVNFVVGSLALGSLILVQRTAIPPAAAWASAPRWAWGGGFLGAFFVAVTVVLTPRLGVLATLTLMLAGQLVASSLLDHHGLLGLAARAFSPTRALGVALVLAGVLLVRR
jgi:transporter family-2 protein